LHCSATTVLEVLLRGATAGVMLATSVGLLAQGPVGSTRALRWAGASFCWSVAAFALHSGGAETQALGPFRGGIGYFWLFAVTLFEDRRFAWYRMLPLVTLTPIAAIAVTLPPAAGNGVWIVYYVLASALALHVLWVVARSWKGDLVEARRSLRIPFVALIAVNGVVLSGLQMTTALGVAIDWEGTVQAAALAVMSQLGAWIFLQARPALFNRVGTPASDSGDGLTPKKIDDRARDDAHPLERLCVSGFATAIRKA
jgi:hypothetical protein